MSIDLSVWLGDAGMLAATPTATEEQRAALAWRRINDKPLHLTFRTPAGVTLAAQIVRVEADSQATTSDSAAGLGPVRRCVVFGVRNHALKTSTVPDTNIGEGYRFIWSGSEYRVISVMTTLGEVQAVAESVG